MSNTILNDGYYSQAIREKMAISIAQSFAVEMAMEFHPFRLDVWDVSDRDNSRNLFNACLSVASLGSPFARRWKVFKKGEQ